jgi:hypothetical protein
MRCCADGAPLHPAQHPFVLRHARPYFHRVPTQAPGPPDHALFLTFPTFTLSTGPDLQYLIGARREQRLEFIGSGIIAKLGAPTIRREDDGHPVV